MDNSIQVTKSTENNIHILAVNEKRLDSLKSPALKTELLRVVAEGANKLVIDLGDVESIDSSGLGALTFGLRQLNENNGSLVLINLSEKVKTVFSIAKLDRIFEIFDSIQHGLASFE